MFDFGWMLTGEGWLNLSTLAFLEIVLGIDNVIFIAIVTQRLPPELRDRTRKLGLALALILRIVLLSTLSWISQLTEPVLSFGGEEVRSLAVSAEALITATGAPDGSGMTAILNHAPIAGGEGGHGAHGGVAVAGDGRFDLTWRDIILLIGGLFLIVKATLEIHSMAERHGPETHGAEAKPAASLTGVIIQVMILDVVFSLDSVITAVGMSNELSIMVLAVILAVLVMMAASGPVAAFIERNPTMKMLALAFLVLIGVALVADGLHEHIPKGFLYFAILFSVAVELLNVRLRRRSEAAKTTAASDPGL